MLEQFERFIDEHYPTHRAFAAEMSITEEHLSRMLSGATPVSGGFRWEFYQKFGAEAAETVFGQPQQEI